VWDNEIMDWFKRAAREVHGERRKQSERRRIADRHRRQRCRSCTHGSHQRRSDTASAAGDGASITVRDSMCPASSSGVHHVGFILRGLNAFSA
jgi:hypothetical protein